MLADTSKVGAVFVTVADALLVAMAFKESVNVATQVKSALGAELPDDKVRLEPLATKFLGIFHRQVSKFHRLDRYLGSPRITHLGTTVVTVAGVMKVGSVFKMVSDAASVALVAGIGHRHRTLYYIGWTTVVGSRRGIAVDTN